MCTKPQQRFGFAPSRVSLGLCSPHGDVVMNVRSRTGCREERGGRKRQQRGKEDISEVCAPGGGGAAPLSTLTSQRDFPLTSFSPQMLLMMELEAGLEEGPRTPTTPLGRIWHTVGSREREQRSEFTQIPADSHALARTLPHVLPTAPSVPFPSPKSLYPPESLSPCLWHSPSSPSLLKPHLNSPQNPRILISDPFLSPGQKHQLNFMERC